MHFVINLRTRTPSDLFPKGPFTAAVAVLDVGVDVALKTNAGITSLPWLHAVRPRQEAIDRLDKDKLFAVSTYAPTKCNPNATKDKSRAARSLHESNRNTVVI